MTWLVKVSRSCFGQLNLNFHCYGLKTDWKMPRKKPFSNKQKKKQLKEKREKQRVKNLGIYLLAREVSIAN